MKKFIFEMISITLFAVVLGGITAKAETLHFTECLQGENQPIEEFDPKLKETCGEEPYTQVTPLKNYYYTHIWGYADTCAEFECEKTSPALTPCPAGQVSDARGNCFKPWSS